MQRITGQADAEAGRLEAEARDADGQAAQWDAIARRDAAIISAEADIVTLAGARDGLAAEATSLHGEEASLAGRLAELAAARDEARQRLLMAPRIPDVTDSLAAVRAAQADLAAIAEAEQHPRARLAEVRARMAAISGDDGELAGAAQQLGWAAVRLADLRRAARGLPSLADQQAVVMAIGTQVAVTLSSQHADPDAVAAACLRLLPEGDARDEAAARLADLAVAGGDAARAVPASVLAGAMLPALAAWADEVAAQSPETFEALRRTYASGQPAAGAPVPGEVLSTAPGLVRLEDGSLRYDPPPRGL